MVRIEPLKKEDAQGETKVIFESMEKQFGMIPNLFATIARYPQALKPVLDFYQALSQGSSISMKLQELANLEASRINGCHYCLHHHTLMARMQGVSKEQIAALKDGVADDSFSDRERMVIEYTRSVTQDAENIPEELFVKLKSYFSESEIVNLTLVIGLMNVFNRFNGALRVELEKSQ